MNSKIFANINTRPAIDLDGGDDYLNTLLTPKQRKAVEEHIPSEPAPLTEVNPEPQAPSIDDVVNASEDEELDETTRMIREALDRREAEEAVVDEEEEDAIEEPQPDTRGPLEHLFEYTFENTLQEIRFSSEWENGTGYLDHIVEADLGLDVGEMGWSVDDNARRILIIATPLGNVAFFERYTPGTGSPFVVVAHAPDVIKAVCPIGNGAISVEAFEHVVKPWSPMNLGHALNALLEEGLCQADHTQE